MLPIYLRLSIKNKEDYMAEYSGYRFEGGVCVRIKEERIWVLSRELFLWYNTYFGIL